MEPSKSNRFNKLEVSLGTPPPFYFDPYFIWVIKSAGGPHEREILAIIETYLFGKPFYGIKKGAKRFGYRTSKGILNGPLLKWYKTGRLSAITNYSNGRLDGEFKQFFPNGIVCESYKHVKSEIDGYRFTHTEDGLLSSISHFKRGKRDGICIWWGLGVAPPLTISSFKEGKRVGSCLQFRNHKLRSFSLYDDGSQTIEKLIGPTGDIELYKLWFGEDTPPHPPRGDIRYKPLKGKYEWSWRDGQETLRKRKWNANWWSYERVYTKKTKLCPV